MYALSQILGLVTTLALVYELAHGRGYRAGHYAGRLYAQNERCPHGDRWDDCIDCRH